MQRHRRLVPLRDLDRGGDMAGVPVRADHREDLAVTDLVEDGVRVLARVDHDHFLVVADEPRVARPVAPRRPQLRASTRSTRASTIRTSA